MRDKPLPTKARMDMKPTAEKNGHPTPPAIVVIVAVLVYAFGAGARPAVALTPGRVDTFSAGTTEGWVSGAANSGLPIVVTSGGPTGTEDAYLFVSAIGGAPGSPMAAINKTQWAGNYLEAGVNAFQMDCLNSGRSALIIRLMVSRASPLGEATDVVLSKPIVLPPGRGWVPVLVALKDLTTMVGSADLALSGATEVRILHRAEGGAFTPRPNIAGALGVDNFQAIGGIAVRTQSTSWGRIKSLHR